MHRIGSSDGRRMVETMADRYTFRAELWRYEGPDPWHFVSLPAEVADDIRAKFGERAAGFGSIKVEAAVGSTRWTTSLFPDKSRGTYLLPVKKAVRVAEHLEESNVVGVTLRF
jgi:Domain of unknown function (DUF1905)